MRRLMEHGVGQMQLLTATPIRWRKQSGRGDRLPGCREESDCEQVKWKATYRQHGCKYEQEREAKDDETKKEPRE